MFYRHQHIGTVFHDNKKALNRMLFSARESDVLLKSVLSCAKNLMLNIWSSALI